MTRFEYVIDGGEGKILCNGTRDGFGFISQEEALTRFRGEPIEWKVKNFEEYGFFGATWRDGVISEDFFEECDRAWANVPIRRAAYYREFPPPHRFDR